MTKHAPAGIELVDWEALPVAGEPLAKRLAFSYIVTAFPPIELLRSFFNP